MEKNRIVIVLLFGLVAALWLLKPSGGNPQVETETLLLEKLREQNDSLQRSNMELKEEILALHKYADSLLWLAKNDRHEINRLKQSEHESIQAIDTFSNDELLRFFAGFKTDTHPSTRRHSVLFFNPAVEGNSQTP